MVEHSFESRVISYFTLTSVQFGPRGHLNVFRSRVFNGTKILTLDFQGKGHFLDIIFICDQCGVETLLLRPHPH